MPLNTKDGALPSTLDRGEWGEKCKKAVALALLSLKEKGKSRSSDVMSYGKGGRGCWVGYRSVGKNWQIPKRTKETDKS